MAAATRTKVCLLCGTTKTIHRLVRLCPHCDNPCSSTSECKLCRRSTATDR